MYYEEKQCEAEILSEEKQSEEEQQSEEKQDDKLGMLGLDSGKATVEDEGALYM
mgnify:CR=1 FL=1